MAKLTGKITKRKLVAAFTEYLEILALENGASDYQKMVDKSFNKYVGPGGMFIRILRKLGVKSKQGSNPVTAVVWLSA